MEALYLIPKWFIGIDIALELLFALITLGVALYSFKIYKISGQKGSRNFGLAFLFISISYFIWSILNIFWISVVSQNVRVLDLSDINLVKTISIYAYLTFFMAGLITLVYTTLKVKSPRTYSLLALMTAFGFLFSSNGFRFLFVMSVLFVFYVFIFYVAEYFSVRNKRTLLMVISFFLLFLSSLSFILASDYYLNYVLGHVLELGAYLVILINLFIISKNETKKK